MDLTTLADATLVAKAQVALDGGYFVSLLSRVTHTVCAATLLGGLIYLRFVLAPAAAAGEAEATLFAGRRKAWALSVAACTGLLLISGIYNLVVVMMTYKNLPALYHPLLGIKFLLALGLMAIMAFLAGKTSLAERLRSSLKLWLNVALVLALSVYVLGAMLRSFRDVPDARVATAVADDAPAFEDNLIETAPIETDE